MAMLPVLLFSLTCRADDVRLSVTPPDSAIVRRTKAPRLVTMSFLGRPFVVRFAPHPACPAKRDSLAADSLARKWQRTQAPNIASLSSLDRSPRLLAPQVCRGTAPVRIEYGVGEWGHTSRLEIFDVRGRRVRTVHAGVLEAGAHSRTWDGRTDGFRAAPAGVYFMVLHTAAGARSQRLVVAR